MTERETIASKAGLKDLQLLKLHAADAPIDAVLADLRGRFGSHPSAFERVDAMKLTRDEYRTARAELVNGANADRQRRDAAAVQARLARKYAK